MNWKLYQINLKISILNHEFEFKGEDKNIINVKNDCLSIHTQKGYTLGSLDTILYYLYTTYIYFSIYTSDPAMSIEKLYYINEFEKYIKTILHDDILKRLKSSCYGKINHDEEIREIWKKKLTLKYIT